MEASVVLSVTVANTSPDPLRIRLLGNLELRRGEVVQPLPQERARELLHCP
jgi:hypothetical protein